MAMFSRLKANRVINGIGNYIGQAQRNRRVIQSDFSTARNLIAGRIFSDMGFMRGAREIYSNTGRETRMAAGGVTVGGGLAVGLWNFRGATNGKNQLG